MIKVIICSIKRKKKIGINGGLDSSQASQCRPGSQALSKSEAGSPVSDLG